MDEISIQMMCVGCGSVASRERSGRLEGETLQIMPTRRRLRHCTMAMAIALIGTERVRHRTSDAELPILHSAFLRSPKRSIQIPNQQESILAQGRVGLTRVLSIARASGCAHRQDERTTGRRESGTVARVRAASAAAAHAAAEHIKSAF